MAIQGKTETKFTVFVLLVLNIFVKNLLNAKSTDAGDAFSKRNALFLRKVSARYYKGPRYSDYVGVRVTDSYCTTLYLRNSGSLEWRT